MTRQIEANWLHVLVSSDHPLADKQVAESIARVLSRYAIDFTAGVKVTVPFDGDDITYVVSAYNKRFLSHVLAAKAASDDVRNNQAAPLGR